MGFHRKFGEYTIVIIQAILYGSKAWKTFGKYNIDVAFFYNKR
jgi:hypothetical protein